MNRIKFNRVIQILYPYLVYYLLYNLIFSVLSDTFAASYGQLFCLMISGAITMIPIIYIYRKLPRLIPEPIKDKKTLINYSFYVIAIIVFAILMNVAITQLGLMKESSGFTEASETLLDGTILVQVLCNAIVIPILEETLFRGIIAGQLYMWHGIYVATIFSAICFGISHFNIVQFLYAFIVGLGLGFLYCKTKRLSLCIIAHSLVNLIVIIFT